jgi:hypothetical protein
MRQKSMHLQKKTARSEGKTIHRAFKIGDFPKKRKIINRFGNIFQKNSLLGFTRGDKCCKMKDKKRISPKGEQNVYY